MEILIGENNEKLRKQALPVEKITQDLWLLAQDMISLIKEKNGAGLSAPQLGVSLRFIVCFLKDKPIALINPEISQSSKETETLEEGCLSLPGTWAMITRPKKITVKAKTLTGKKIKKTLSGISARIIQHEIDHLDGILFIDRILKK